MLQYQIQKDIFELNKMGISHPNIQNVIKIVLNNYDYSNMSKSNLDLLLISGICSYYPNYYSNDQNFRQCVNSILNLIYLNNIFNLKKNKTMDNDGNFGIYDDNNPKKNNDSNFGIYDDNNPKKNNDGNFGIYDDNIPKKNKDGNFGIYDDNNPKKNIDGNFGIYDDNINEKRNNREGNFDNYANNRNNNMNIFGNNKKVQGNFDIYDDSNISDNNVNNNQNNYNFNNNPNNFSNNNNNFCNNNNNNFGYNNDGINPNFNNKQTIAIIFKQTNGNKIQLKLSPNETIEQSFKKYMNFFANSNNNRFDFIFNGNRIDKFSKETIDSIFYDNCIIQVLEK